MRPFLLALTFLLAAAPALAEPVRAGALTIETATVSATLGRSTTTAAYVTIENDGSEPDRLVGASSPVAERASLHINLMDGATMRMRPVSQVDLPPGETIAMTPGSGLHLMLEGLREPLREGAAAPIVLSFERAGEVEVQARVVRPGAHRH